MIEEESIGGAIFRYQLEDWWLSEFSAEERFVVANVYKPMMSTGRPLIDGPAKRQPELMAGPFLANVAQWLSKRDTYVQAIKFADKGREIGAHPEDVSNRHFMYANLCKVYYRWRDEVPGALELAIAMCEANINQMPRLTPVLDDGIVIGHYCFRQLAIIEEKRGNIDRAIAIAQRAQEEGWRGDWEKRVDRLRKKQSSKRLLR